MKTLMLVKFPNRPEGIEKGLTCEQKLATIKGEINSAIEDRVEELRIEAGKLHGTMEQVLFRISSQGFHVKLDDLRTGKWYKISTEIQVLQEVIEFIEALE